LTRALVAAPDSPYKGLGAFDETELDALLFFGRERDTETIASNLLAARFTILFGATGAGKSSVVRAGVVHRARALAPDSIVLVHDGWAGDPVANLGATVGGGGGTLAELFADVTAEHGGDLYLVLDQFEELFLYQDGTALARELAAVVTRADLRVNVLVAVRDDQLSRLDALTGHLPDVFGNALPLEHLDREAAWAAITGPVGRYNELADAAVSIEPELVDAVLDEVAVGRVALGGVAVGTAEPGGGDRIEAAYLQLVMQRLWDAEREQGSSVLRRGTLADLGGAQEIVRADFDRAIASLPPARRDVAARVFNHLVTPSGTKIAHRIDDLAGYASVDESELRSVVRALSADRILRPLGERVEIFHDVLADAVLAWRTQHDAARALEEQRRESERRHRSILVALGAALLALAAMAVLAVYALTQRSQARDRADAARVAARRANARALDSQAGRLIPVQGARRDPELGLELAIRAARLSSTVEAEDTLRRALATSFVRRVLPDRQVVEASFDARGDRLVVGSRDGRVGVYDATGRHQIATIDTRHKLSSAVPSPDGSLVATTVPGRAASLWDVATGRLAHRLAPATAVAFDDTGRRIVTAEGRTATLWDTASASRVAPLHQDEPIRRIGFSPHGAWIVTFDAGTLVHVFDVPSGALVRTFDHRARVSSALVAPDENTVVTAGANKLARSWSLRTNDLLHGFRGHVGEVTSVAVSPRGRLLLTTSTDTAARIWRLADAGLVTTLTGHTGRVFGGQFSADGGSVLTWSADGTARLWRSNGDFTKAILAGPGGAVRSASIGAGNTVVTLSADRRARVWNVPIRPALVPVARFEGHPRAAAFSRDGARVAVTNGVDVDVRNTADGRPVVQLRTGPVRHVAANADGSRVAVVTPTEVSVWSTADGSLLRSFPGAATAVALDRDRSVASGNVDGTVVVHPLHGGPAVRLSGPEARVTALAFGVAGKRVAAGYANGKVAGWSVPRHRLTFARTVHDAGTIVTGVTFDRTGRRLATTGRDTRVFVLHAATGAQLEALPGHTAAVNGAAFSPGGHWLVSAGPGTAGLWDLATGERLFFLDGHRGRLLAATFDDAGHRVSTVGADGTLRTYACGLCLSEAELLRLADNRLAATGRRLTARERRLYLRP
jgi:WD40 repeat protein